MQNGVTINRPPRDGHMAFVRSPDGISIELLQEGDALPEQEPWKSMENSGSLVVIYFNSFYFFIFKRSGLFTS